MRNFVPFKVQFLLFLGLLTTNSIQAQLLKLWVIDEKKQPVLDIWVRTNLNLPNLRTCNEELYLSIPNTFSKVITISLENIEEEWKIIKVLPLGILINKNKIFIPNTAKYQTTKIELTLKPIKSKKSYISAIDLPANNPNPTSRKYVVQIITLKNPMKTDIREKIETLMGISIEEIELKNKYQYCFKESYNTKQEAMKTKDKIDALAPKFSLSQSLIIRR